MVFIVFAQYLCGKCLTNWLGRNGWWFADLVFIIFNSLVCSYLSKHQHSRARECWCFSGHVKIFDVTQQVQVLKSSREWWEFEREWWKRYGTTVMMRKKEHHHLSLATSHHQATTRPTTQPTNKLSEQANKRKKRKWASLSWTSHAHSYITHHTSYL